METPTNKKAKIIKRKKELPMIVTSSPLESIEPPPLATRWKSTTGADELQSKRMEAAKKFVSLTSEFWASLYEPGLRDLSDKARANHVFGPHVCCTPEAGGTVFINLDDRAWLKVTLENVTEAYQDVTRTSKVDHRATMEQTLDLVRYICKEHGKASWVLPRLDKGVAK
jgi:hypothetical protein